ncbi:MAG: hypothetical protein RSE58_09190 [Clostridia bacterium]
MHQTEEKKHSFRDLFIMIENGKPKNTFLLYSFALSFFFLAVYAFAYILLAKPVELVFQRISMNLAAWMEAFLPAVAGTALCALCQLIAKDKRLAVAAFVWLGLYTVVFFLIALCSFGAEDLFLFFNLFSQLTVFPLLLGGGLTCWVAIRAMRKKREE